MNELSVYKQMKQGASECLAVMKREIGMKTGCTPFAIKLITALNELKPKTQQEELDIANTLLSGLQTLMQGGITAEDYDKIDLVNRGGKLVPSARVEAFLRAAARKGYRITDTIVAVPKEDADTTYFKENFCGGDIVYTLEDRRYNMDRSVTAERLHNRYFAKFICRLDIHDVKQHRRIAMTTCEMSLAELLAIASASEQGLYKSKWEEYNTQWGTKKRKVISNELNDEKAFWIKWTGEMVNKTIIRRALKRIKEVLPELTESIYAFEQDEFIESTPPTEQQPPIELPVIEDVQNVNLYHMTVEQNADAREMFDLYKANPKLAEDKFIEIKQMIESGMDIQQIINEEYASIVVLKKSKQKWAEIGGYFDEKGKA